MRIDVARAVAAAAAVTGLLIVVVVARSSATHPFVDHSGHGPSRAAPTVSIPTLSESAALSSDASGAHLDRAANGLHAAILALVVLIVVGTVAFALRFRLRFARRVALGPAAVSGPAVDAFATVPAGVTAGIESGYDALERGPASEAIIACWLHVEAAADAAGSAPRPTETSSEFVDRVLRAYGVREAPLRTLAELYREARFSSHAIAETSRGEARRCLDTIRRDLAGARAPR